MIEARIGLQAALNGDRTRDEHAAGPVLVEELVRDAAACVAAGARAIHLHPRGPEGRETLDAGVVNEVVTEVRMACGVPVSVTTSAEPDPERRLALVRSWHAPDCTSVNLSETGANELMEALVEAGVGIEAGHPDPGRARRSRRRRRHAWCYAATRRALLPGLYPRRHRRSYVTGGALAEGRGFARVVAGAVDRARRRALKLE